MSEKTESKCQDDGIAPAHDASVAAPPLLPGLHLIATPIGNAADITLRALSTLRRAGMLVCEDTRQSRKLLEIHGIPLAGRKMVSYHDQSNAGRREQILEWLHNGHSVALMSDAGTPMIADPGFRLVAEARAAGLPVHALPGASAVLTALCLAGLPTNRFLFSGFLPPKSAARRVALEEIRSLASTLVFYESPRRLAATLFDMSEVLGGTRLAAVTRELTKKFEEVRNDSLAGLASAYSNEPAPKGEIVIVIGPPDEAVQKREAEASLDDALLTALETMTLKDAAREVALSLSLPKRDVYARAITLSGK